MAEVVSISLNERKAKGKGPVHRLRAEGIVPVSFYGADYKEALVLQVPTVDIAGLANSSHWETVRVEAQLPSGTKELCLMREIQRNPLNDEILHIDFMQLIKGHKIKVNIPVEPVNKETCEGVKLGGVFEQVIHEIEIDVLPSEIPESIRYDVSAMKIGDFVRLSDLQLPESAELALEGEEIVFSVSYAKNIIEEEPAAEEGTEAEPQEVKVVAKGKAKEETEE